MKVYKFIDSRPVYITMTLTDEHKASQDITDEHKLRKALDLSETKASGAMTDEHKVTGTIDGD